MSAETVLAALADHTRRSVLETLTAHAPASASTLARELPISRQMVLKHLAVLQGCGLVTSTPSGREVLFQVRTEPLAETAEWLSELASQWDSHLAELKVRAEQTDQHARPL